MNDDCSPLEMVARGLTIPRYQRIVRAAEAEIERLQRALEERGQEVYYLRGLLRKAWQASESPTPTEWNELLREIRAVLISRDERDLNG